MELAISDGMSASIELLGELLLESFSWLLPVPDREITHTWAALGLAIVSLATSALVFLLGYGTSDWLLVCVLVALGGLGWAGLAVVRGPYSPVANALAVIVNLVAAGVPFVLAAAA